MSGFIAPVSAFSSYRGGSVTNVRPGRFAVDRRMRRYPEIARIPAALKRTPAPRLC